MLEPKSSCTSLSHQPASKTEVDSRMGDISAFELRKRPIPLLQLILSLMETRAGGTSCVRRESSIHTDIGRKDCKWRVEVRVEGIGEAKSDGLKGRRKRKKPDSQIQYTIATDADINMQKQGDLEHDQLNQ